MPRGDDAYLIQTGPEAGLFFVVKAKSQPPKRLALNHSLNAPDVCEHVCFAAPVDARCDSVSHRPIIQVLRAGR